MLPVMSRRTWGCQTEGHPETDTLKPYLPASSLPAIVPPLASPPVCPERTHWEINSLAGTCWPLDHQSIGSQSLAGPDIQWDLTLMCSICILASRNCFSCQAAQLIACHSLLSETAASRRCSFRDDLNFHFSGSSLSSSARDKTESTEELVPVRLFGGQRANISWVGPRRRY